MHFRIILLLLFLTLRSVGQVKPPDLLQTGRQFQHNRYLRHWAATIPGFKLDEFKYQDEAKFEEVGCGPIDAGSADFREYISLYQPLLSYSADSARFLDFYSGEVALKRTPGKKQLEVLRDVDQTLLLTDMKRKNSCRIAFLGSRTRIEEAEWISDSRFICVGTSYDGESFHPFIYLSDIKTKQIFHYLPEGKANDRKVKYISPKWTKLHVPREEL